ncbi:hypothetical protein [Microbacterium sp. zg.Y909]|uniref:hypothetical protein n=1 Tax=Microbacterium sp. zg.Y909 TaxID=2969413 RepID=UPI00214CC945|nr:hypothetical protein [Microbacterium sp. zg.Y909]
MAMVGVVALPPASILNLTAANSHVPSVMGYLGLWFVVCGMLGGPAIAIQRARRTSRVLAPALAAGFALAAGLILWVALEFVDPAGHGLYSLAVAAPFILFGICAVTAIAAFIPTRHWPRAGMGAVGIAAAVVLISLLR